MAFFSRSKFTWKKRGRYTEIDPDEILMDSHNVSRFDRDQLEGRMEQPISKTALYSVLVFFILVASVYIFQAINLQLINGDDYSNRSQKNLLRPVPIFAARGVIYDRKGVPLAWNAPNDIIDNASSSDILSASSTSAVANAVNIESSVSRREYATSTGFAHVLGYVQYPSKDNNGFYYKEDFTGVDGVEKYYDSLLQGVNGSRLIEVDARGHVISENVVRSADAGGNLNLSIDAGVEAELYKNLENVAQTAGFTGGAGIIMDVHTGEVLALASYPEFDPSVMSDKTDKEAVKALLADKNLPFLDRVVGGLYTPGSIIKPYEAMGALNEKLIDPMKTIVDSGSISIPNPYDPKLVSIFKSFKALGPVNMREAIAKSSDVYFYTIGGGYKNQAGLGITKIDKYLGMFGFGSSTAASFFSGPAGQIPTPDWKKKTFNEAWYLGDTYHTAIGQYGFQVTPIQVVRAVAAIANYGNILTPTILKDEGPHIERTVDLPQSDFNIVREGMRLGVTEGTGIAVNKPYVNVASKSGTAELGISRNYINSWFTGFWPYENPHYAFAIIMEHAPADTTVTASRVLNYQLDWMHTNTPEYLK